jgi:two-component system, OmpR family, response regulator ChvI
MRDKTPSQSGKGIGKRNSNRIRSTSSTQSVTRKKKDPSSYRILIVDDEPDIASLYKLVLEGAGFKVDVFNDSIAALSKLKKIYSSYSPRLLPPQTITTGATTAMTPTTTTAAAKLYDLMLLDIQIPKINGFELYREIKKIMKEHKEEKEKEGEGEEQNVKICFITAHEVYYEHLKQEFPKIDVGCYIKKPINTSDLIKRIKQELLLE